MSQAPPTNPITREKFDAVLFDLDGVLTATAKVHAMSWKRMFDEFLRKRAARTGEPFRPFDIAADYTSHVDGKPRYDGVRDFLRAREITVPEGSHDDPPGRETVCGLGNRKNELVNAVIAEDGVEVFEGSLSFLHDVRRQGFRTAVVTSSANCDIVLEAAGMQGLFDVQVDGNTIIDEHLSGKPAPDSFLRAAELLGVTPERSVVVEDAISGVEAGRNGEFGLVIGVARKGNFDQLARHGAGLVIGDLGELLQPAGRQ